MTNKNLSDMLRSINREAFNQLQQARQRAIDHRFKLIGIALTLECMIDGHHHDAESFEHSMCYLDNCETLLIEAMIHAYKMRLGMMQYEAEEAPVRECPPVLSNVA